MRTASRYFYLSYARSTPTLEDRSVHPDHWVRVFFGDLHNAVLSLAGRTGEVGSVDFRVPTATDWKLELARRIGVAEVFVQLLSPQYLTRSWALSEKATFHARMTAARTTCAGAHLQPVLWVPISQHTADDGVRAAHALAPDIAAYGENGLRALCMLTLYRDEYLAVVNRLAATIVDIVHRHPLGPTSAQALVVPEPFAGPFMVAVAAPTLTTLPPGRRPTAYGDGSTLWRPFGNVPALPIAGYAAYVAEQLGVAATVASLGPDGSMPGPGAGVLIVDPWVMTEPSTMSAVTAAIEHLPEWVAVAIVVDETDPEHDARGAALATSMASVVAASGQRHVTTVRTLDEIVEAMPFVIATMQRRYLRPFPMRGPHVMDPWQTWHTR
ncbi:MAG TPA: FxsC protein [Candidatus Limnocylindrales bacterium]|nr:FxsC protein [Candidatus Limnocylindrales bacterium]